MDRWWFLTWRTYGTWVPGQDGLVGYYHPPSGPRRNDNVPGELPTEAIPALAKYAREQMIQEAVFLTRPQADVVLSQLHETAAYRKWSLSAAAILPAHVHIVFGVTGDPTSTTLLRDFKSYCSRALNETGRQLERRKWWAERGSTRFLKDVTCRIRAVRYVRDQEDPLLVWLSDETRSLVEPPA